MRMSSCRWQRWYAAGKKQPRLGRVLIPLLLRSHPKDFNALMAPCHPKASTAIALGEMRNVMFMSFSAAESGVTWTVRS